MPRKQFYDHGIRGLPMPITLVGSNGTDTVGGILTAQHDQIPFIPRGTCGGAFHFPSTILTHSITFLECLKKRKLMYYRPFGVSYINPIVLCGGDPHISPRL